MMLIKRNLTPTKSSQTLVFHNAGNWNELLFKDALLLNHINYH